jgi:hypothetical protein
VAGIGTVELCLGLVLAVALVAEVAVGRSDLPWTMVPNGDLGTLRQLEEKIIQPSAEPAVVVYGTSRARGAFVPTRMEELLGLQRGQVLNLGMGGAHIFDAVVAYERNRAKLSRARLHVVQIDPFQFSRGIPPNSRYRLLASWEDRMAYTGAHRLRLMADLAFRLDDALPLINLYVKERVRNGRAPQGAEVDQYGRLALVPIGDEQDPREFNDARHRYWVKFFYEDYEYSAGFEAQFLRLVRMIREDGGQVILVEMPSVDPFRAMLRERAGDPYGTFHTRMVRLAAERGIPYPRWPSPAAIGFQDRDFRDWGHFNTSAALKFSEHFVRWLQACREAGCPNREGGA